MDEFDKIQLEGLKWTVNHCYHGSEFYRQKLDKVNVKPENINSLDDLKRLPFTTVEDLREGYPFPLLSVPLENIVRIQSSSGTTGKRKILGYTAKDISSWAEIVARCKLMAGVTKHDIVQISAGYGLWTGGMGFQLGYENLGALTIPIGPGNIDMQLQFLIDFKTTVLESTTSMALLLAEEIKRRDLKGINLNKVIVGAERSSIATRERIKNLLNVEHVYNTFGLVELYGPGVGTECQYHDGMHYWSDYFILELLNPETLEPVSEGEVGEIVYTSLKKEGTPLIRYRSRDLARLIPGKCKCGSPFPRIDDIHGRSDDMIIFRGVNIYPSQIDEILSSFNDINCEYQIHLNRVGGIDYMDIKVERGDNISPEKDELISKNIENAVKKKVLVSPKVEIVDYQSLPRTDKKTRRVFDNRNI